MKSKITIITVCYNSEKAIEKTILSVLNQSYQDIEYIIVDGKSKDNTIEIINSYEMKLKERKIEFKFISEKDNGIYDAMNKGIRLSTGEWIIFMNSDDSFYDNNVIENFFNKEIDKSVSLIYGDICYNFENRDVIGKNNKIGHSFFINDTICHQALFIKRDAYLNYNGFSKEYKIVADKEVILKLFFENRNSLMYFPIIVANYKMDGVSAKQRNLSLEENRKLVKKFYKKEVIFVFDILFEIKKIYYKTGSYIKKFLNGGGKN